METVKRDDPDNAGEELRVQDLCSGSEFPKRTMKASSEMHFLKQQEAWQFNSNSFVHKLEFQ